MIGYDTSLNDHKEQYVLYRKVQIILDQPFLWECIHKFVCLWLEKCQTRRNCDNVVLNLNSSNTCFYIRTNMPLIFDVWISLKQINRCFKMFSAQLPTYVLGWKFCNTGFNTHWWCLDHLGFNIRWRWVDFLVRTADLHLSGCQSKNR